MGEGEGCGERGERCGIEWGEGVWDVGGGVTVTHLTEVLHVWWNTLWGG